MDVTFSFPTLEIPQDGPSLRPDSGPAIILIGMAGAGKSTIGPILAERLNWPYLDIDTLLQRKFTLTPQNLLDFVGPDTYCVVEEELTLGISPGPRVIATSGSVIYSSASLTHLKQLGTLVWIDPPLETLLQRLTTHPDRGLIRRYPNQPLDELIHERRSLYAQCADLTYHPTHKQPLQQASEILSRLGWGFYTVTTSY